MKYFIIIIFLFNIMIAGQNKGYRLCNAEIVQKVDYGTYCTMIVKKTDGHYENILIDCDEFDDYVLNSKLCFGDCKCTIT